ncbi:hypothetical protein GGI1_24366, partial [Acidithiobacillus sp. GGI-221]
MMKYLIAKFAQVKTDGIRKLFEDDDDADSRKNALNDRRGKKYATTPARMAPRTIWMPPAMTTASRKAEKLGKVCMAR